VTVEQLAFPGRPAIVEKVAFYHGGDVLYTLNGIPGMWDEQCLANSDRSRGGVEIAMNWRTHVRSEFARLGKHVDETVVEEMAQHADAAWQEGRADGQSSDAITRTGS
jgi:hypothetical protein